MWIYFLGTSSIQTPVKLSQSGSTRSTGSGSNVKRPSIYHDDNSKVFNFGEARVREYLSSLSSEESSSCSSSSGHNVEKTSDQFVLSPVLRKKWKKSTLDLEGNASSQSENTEVKSPQNLVEMSHRLSSGTETSFTTLSPNLRNAPEEQYETVTGEGSPGTVSERLGNLAEISPETLSALDQRPEGPLTRSRKRRLDDTSPGSGSNSVVGETVCEGESEPRHKTHRKRHHRHKHRRGAKKAKRIPTITVE